MLKSDQRSTPESRCPVCCITERWDKRNASRRRLGLAAWQKKSAWFCCQQMRSWETHAPLYKFTQAAGCRRPCWEAGCLLSSAAIFQGLGKGPAARLFSCLAGFLGCGFRAYYWHPHIRVTGSAKTAVTAQITNQPFGWLVSRSLCNVWMLDSQKFKINLYIYIQLYRRAGETFSSFNYIYTYL